jgi:antibiotic biosynthesis monooxygenase (ABM) superfamily enzyme
LQLLLLLPEFGVLAVVAVVLVHTVAAVGLVGIHLVIPAVLLLVAVHLSIDGFTRKYLTNGYRKIIKRF